MAEMARLMERYRDVLQERMGVTVQSVDEETLAFEVAGLNVLAFLEERDPEYLHLAAIFPPPEEQYEELEILRLCNQVTKEAKVAKVVVDPQGDLIVSAEMLVAAPDCMPTVEQLTAVLPRALTTIFNAVGKVSMSLELLGISQAVYEDGADPEAADDPNTRSHGKDLKRNKPGTDAPE